MRVLSDDDVRAIESIIGRSLVDTELVEVESAEALPQVSVDVTRLVGMRSSQLAIKYLREVVPSARIGKLVEFLEGVMEHSTLSS